MLYIISHADYEDYSPTIVQGPEQPDWEAYCKSLLPEACERALRTADGWVGWPVIVEKIIEILGERGYQVVNLTEASFFGLGIIDRPTDDRLGHLPAELLQRICDYNIEFRRKLNAGELDDMDDEN